MPAQIDYRSPSRFPADEVYATTVDPDYLRARLARMGGPGAELLEHTADADGARYRLLQGLDKALLPPLVQSLVPGNLVIERTESVRKRGPGDYDGHVDVKILNTPVTAEGGMRLQDAAGGSEFAVNADVTVNVPLIGGRIEGMIAEQVQNLLVAESAFTQEWLRERSA